MILGLPDILFWSWLYAGIVSTLWIIFLVLFVLTPSNGRKLLSARLKKTGLLAIFGKASLRFVKTFSFGPGWVRTEEGQKYIWPIPPKDEKKRKSWDAVRDVMSKVDRIDNIPVLAVSEVDAVAVNSDTLLTLEAYTKGYEDKGEIQLEVPINVKVKGNPSASDLTLKEKMKVYIPVSPKTVTEVLRSMLTTEHIDVFEARIIDETEKRHKTGEWGPILKVIGVIGAVTTVAIIAMILTAGMI